MNPQDGLSLARGLSELFQTGWGLAAFFAVTTGYFYWRAARVQAEREADLKARIEEYRRFEDRVRDSQVLRSVNETMQSVRDLLPPKPEIRP